MGGSVKKSWQTNIEKPQKDFLQRNIFDPHNDAWNRNIRDPLAKLGDKLGNLGSDNNSDTNITKQLEDEKKKQEEELKNIGPLPVLTDPIDDLDSKRRKRLAALRSGIVSTIRTSTKGVTDSPSLLSPVAVGTGYKTKLGQ